MTYYKLARPDGYDFHTGRTINYRGSIGQIVRPPNDTMPARLCTSSVLHASLRAEDCFQGASLPCSLYEVEGRPVCADTTKAGFVEMRVLRELDPATHFKWRYAQAANPLSPLALPLCSVPSAHDLVLMRQWNSVWESVRDSVRDSVWESVRASVGESVGESVWDCVRARVWESVGESVGDSVWDCVRARVWESVRARVWDSVRASMWAYIGWIFAPVVTDWKHVPKNRGGRYPYIASVRLWQRGLIPSYDGKKWRLHSGDKATIVYAG